MTQVVKRNLIALFVAVACATFIVLLGARVSAQDVQEDGTIVEGTEQQVETNTDDASVDGDVVEEDSAEETTETTEEPDASDTYSFTAQPGDSYTKIARKAVQIYGIDNTVELSGAQIVYLETNLTLLAGSPELQVGEAVSINKATISEWVEKAQALSDEVKAEWQVYADRVDFNTDNVGEARN